MVLAAETNDTEGLAYQTQAACWPAFLKMELRLGTNWPERYPQNKILGDPLASARETNCKNKLIKNPNFNPPRIDRTWWKNGIHGLRKLTESLEQGEVSDGGTITPCSCAEAKDFRELAKAHSLNTKFALLCYDIKPEDKETAEAVNATKKWVRLTGGRWRQYWISPLTQELPTWAQEPEVNTVAKEAIPVEEELTSFRVTFVKSPHQPTMGHCDQKTSSVTCEALPEGSNARGYVGIKFLIMKLLWAPLRPPKNTLKKFSLLQDIDMPFSPASIRITKESLSNGSALRKVKNPFQYYADAKKRAKEEGVGLALKRGKRNKPGPHWD